MTIGLIRGGLRDGFAAWLGFTTPSAIALIVFAYGITALNDSLSRHRDCSFWLMYRYPYIWRTDSQPYPGKFFTHRKHGLILCILPSSSLSLDCVYRELYTRLKYIPFL